MANEKRIRQGGIGGLVEDNPLTAAATLLTAAGLAAVNGGVDSSHHLAICLDPDGIAGAPEIAYVTSLTAGAGATGATGLLRGQEGTTARQHDQDTPWIHGLTPRDFQRVVQTIYAPGSGSVAYGTNTMADIDATHLPALSIYAYAGDILEWGFEGTFGPTGSGNTMKLDGLITLPDTTTTSFKGGNDCTFRHDFPSTGIDTLNAKGLYVATQTGVHTVKPQWANSASITLYYGGGGVVPVLHIVKNLGPPAD